MSLYDRQLRINLSSSGNAMIGRSLASELKADLTQKAHMLHGEVEIFLKQIRSS